MIVSIPDSGLSFDIPESERVIWASGDYPVVVDASDYEYLNSFKWSIKPSSLTYYAHSSIKINGTKRCVKMHRLIMGFPNGMVVHHRNHHGWYNTRSNLEVITQAQNAKDRTPDNSVPRFYRDVIRIRSDHKYTMGVNLSKKTGMYEACYRDILVGEYIDYMSAVDAHDYYVCIKEGYKAHTIFPGNKNIFILNLERLGYQMDANGGFKVGE